MKIIYEIAHVKLYVAENDLVELCIEDTEVYDRFDDILPEQFDIEDYSITSEQKNGISTYTMHFTENVDRENLLNAVKSISESEVIEIYKMNNK